LVANHGLDVADADLWSRDCSERVIGVMDGFVLAAKVVVGRFARDPRAASELELGERVGVHLLEVVDGSRTAAGRRRTRAAVLFVLPADRERYDVLIAEVARVPEVAWLFTDQIETEPTREQELLERVARIERAQRILEGAAGDVAPKRS